MVKVLLLEDVVITGLQRGQFSLGIPFFLLLCLELCDFHGIFPVFLFHCDAFTTKCFQHSFCFFSNGPDKTATASAVESSFFANDTVHSNQPFQNCSDSNRRDERSCQLNGYDRVSIRHSQSHYSRDNVQGCRGYNGCLRDPVFGPGHGQCCGSACKCVRDYFGRDPIQLCCGYNTGRVERNWRTICCRDGSVVNGDNAFWNGI